MKGLLKVALLLAFFISGTVRAEEKIAFIDAQETVKRYYRYELLQDQILQQKDDFEREKEELAKEIQTLKEEVEILRADARDEDLGEEVRANKRDLLEEKLVDLQAKELEALEFEKLRIDQINQQTVRMNRILYDEVRTAVNNYAKAHDYSAVIDSSTLSRNGFVAVLYMSPEVDITANIVQILNEGKVDNL